MAGKEFRDECLSKQYIFPIVPVTNYHKHSGFMKIIIYSPIIVEARSRKSVSLG